MIRARSKRLSICSNHRDADVKRGNRPCQMLEDGSFHEGDLHSIIKKGSASICIDWGDGGVGK